MANLDLLIVNVALPTVGAAFSGGGRGVTLGSVSWVLNAYAIAFAALLEVAGRAGDRIGRRPVFLAGIAVFTLASLGCALAPNLGTLVVPGWCRPSGRPPRCRHPWPCCWRRCRPPSARSRSRWSAPT
ncbi:MFS transporter [Streptomyces sp. NPDC051664]|uniref:MFS transporter n=1 Tax=Streptomyces sp. NPDC051664 TaxID=3365668 RepID=UPI00378EA895